MFEYLLSYSQDRQDPFKKTIDDLFSLVDKFGDQVKDILSYDLRCTVVYNFLYYSYCPAVLFRAHLVSRFD